MVTGRARSWLAAAGVGAVVTLAASGGAPEVALASAPPSGSALGVQAEASRVLPAATTEDEDGSSAFAACVRGERSGRLVLLMDESGSLEDADPEAVRVDAATHLLRSWAQQVEGSDIDLQVQIMGFAASASPATDWTPVGETDTLIGEVEGYRDRNTGGQTDYLMGLNAARSSVSGADSSCRAVVWFSDGRLDVHSTYSVDGEEHLKPYLDEDVSGAEATAAAEEAICRPGGAADQLRVGGINLLGIGLASSTAGFEDFDLMKAVATEASCGEAEPSGSFYLAEDLEGLLFAFANVARAEKPILQDGAVCQAEVVDECIHKFVLDDSIAGVSLMITSEQPGLDLVMIPPKGDQVTIAGEEEASDASVEGAEAEVRRLSERTSSLQLTSQGDWSGVWGVALVDPTSNSATARSQSSLHLTPDVQPRWIPGDPWRSGEETEVRIGLERADGTQIDPADLLGDLTLDVDFVGPDGQPVSLARGIDASGLSRPLALDLSGSDAGQARLDMELGLTTADFEDAEGEVVPGTTLAPMAVSHRAQVEPPLGMPSLGENITFGRVLDGEATDGELSVTGPGCVWIDTASAQVLAAPEPAVPASLSSSADSAETCLRVEEGQTAALPVQLSTSAPAVGGLQGEATMHLAPLEDASREITMIRPFSADLDKTPNQTVFWTTAIALVAAAILIPLGLLYGTKWWTSRVPGRALLGEVFGLELEGDQVVGGIPEKLRAHHFRQPIDVPRKGARTLKIGSAQIRTTAGLSPLGTGEARMSVPGMVGVSDTDKRPASDGAARLPLAVHDHWAVFREQQTDRGLLVYLTSLERPRSEVEEELARLSRELSSDLRAIDSSGVRAGGSKMKGAGAAAGTATVATTSESDGFHFGESDFGADQDWDTTLSQGQDGPAATLPGADLGRQARPEPVEPPPSRERSSKDGAGTEDDFDFDFDFDPRSDD